MQFKLIGINIRLQRATLHLKLKSKKNYLFTPLDREEIERSTK